MAVPIRKNKQKTKKNKNLSGAEIIKIALLITACLVMVLAIASIIIRYVRHLTNH